MMDQLANAAAPLTADEVHKAVLHLAAAVHNLQASVEEIIRRTGIKSSGIGPAQQHEKALHLSRLELAETLKILVKDPSDG